MLESSTEPTDADTLEADILAALVGDPAETRMLETVIAAALAGDEETLDALIAQGVRVNPMHADIVTFAGEKILAGETLFRAISQTPPISDSCIMKMAQLLPFYLQYRADFSAELAERYNANNYDAAPDTHLGAFEHAHMSGRHALALGLFRHFMETSLSSRAPDARQQRRLASTLSLTTPDSANYHALMALGAFAMEYYHEFNIPIRHAYAGLREPIGVSARQLSKFGREAVSDLHSMFRRQYNYLFQGCVVDMCRHADIPEKELLDLLNVEAKWDIYGACHQIMQNKFVQMHSMTDLIGLGHAWQQEKSVFPIALRPYAAEHAKWEPLFKLRRNRIRVTSGEAEGCWIHELTTAHAVEADGQVMIHCIADRIPGCLKGEESIFSIRDADGKRLSTFVVWREHGDVAFSSIEGVRSENASAVANAAYAWLENEWNSGQLVRNTRDGATKDCLAKRTRHPLFYSMGYDPQPEALNRVFAEFTMPHRRALLCDKHGNIKPTKVDLIAGHHHFGNGRSMAYSEMTARDFFRLSGLAEKMQETMEYILSRHATRTPFGKEPEPSYDKLSKLKEAWASYNALPFDYQQEQDPSQTNHALRQQTRAPRRMARG